MGAVSPAVLPSYELFWDITRRRVVIVYRRFGQRIAYSSWTS
jgi:hypothetical protein